MEENGPTSIRKGTARRVWSYAARYHLRLLIFFILVAISAALNVLTPLLAGKIINAIVAGGDTSATKAEVAGLAAGIAGFAILDAILGVISRWLSARAGQGLVADMRRDVFEHVQRMPVAFFSRTRTGALVSRLNNDVLGVQSAVTSTLASALSNAVQVIISLIVMVTLAWQVTVLGVLLLPVFVLPARRMGRAVVKLQREYSDLNAGMTTQMTERFSAAGATLVKLFGRRRKEADDFGARAVEVRDVAVRTAMVTRAFVTTLALVSALAQALVYGVGGYLAVKGEIEPGTVVTLALLLTRLYTPMTALASARVNVMTALVSFERLFEILDLKQMITERPDAGGLPAGPVTVTMRQVRFTYPSAEKVSLASLEDVATLDDRLGEEVLRGIDLEVGGGQMLALVGSSGAGKTTIASLIARLYDVDSGAVELSGIDVRDLTFAAISRAVGVITQEGHLFHDTIRGNLVYAAPHASDLEMVDALHRAQLGDVLEGMPDGLDTVVGEQGYRFSGGERQRLTIARVLLARPRVVILDEATAHLDPKSEAAVQGALAEALVGRTAIVIAHRLSTIRAADEIAVVEQGKIVERGTHEELLAAGGQYAELHDTQFGDDNFTGFRTMIRKLRHTLTG